jgi:hypothetical protein
MSDHDRISNNSGESAHLRARTNLDFSIKFLMAIFGDIIIPSFQIIVDNIRSLELGALIAVARGCDNFNQICEEMDVPPSTKKTVFDRLKLFFRDLESAGVIILKDNKLGGRARRYKISMSDSYPLKPILASMRVPKYQKRRKIKCVKKQVSDTFVVE